MASPPPPWVKDTGENCVLAAGNTFFFSSLSSVGGDNQDCVSKAVTTLFHIAPDYLPYVQRRTFFFFFQRPRCRTRLQQENLLNREREAAAVRRTPSLSRSVKRCKLVDTQRGPSRRRPPPVLFSSNFSETVELVQRNDSESTARQRRDRFIAAL